MLRFEGQLHQTGVGLNFAIADRVRAGGPAGPRAREPLERVPEYSGPDRQRSRRAFQPPLQNATQEMRKSTHGNISKSALICQNGPTGSMV